MSLDLEQHLKRQIAFSRATFGPGERRQGVCDHIRKELVEVEATGSPLDAATEWTDVVILALDGLTRSLRAAGMNTDDAATEAVAHIRRKQARNENRDWPDWRNADPNKAIEHVRAGE
jgi:hypothetical protein